MLLSPLESAEGGLPTPLCGTSLGNRPKILHPRPSSTLVYWPAGGSDLLGREILEVVYNWFP